MLLLFLLLVAFSEYVVPSTIPVVTIRDGQVGGREYATENNKVYYAFQGIPYAMPPVGELRFEPPKPPKPWTGILDGTDDSKACVSIKFPINQDTESEDCLFINVYTPNYKPWPWRRLPVMFWIYGGDFVEGNDLKKDYGPDFFMEEDVILVTFNYRLGPLGFLSTGDKELPGNNGLKDQLLALKWTYENILYFGGNPNKITIFGQSAGAASVASHILSEKSKGLFRAAIVQSSSALVPWALDLDPKSYAFKLAEKIGYHGKNTQEFKSFLKKRSVMDIYTATDYVKIDWPVLEVKQEEAFLTESNYELLQNGKFNKVPIIIGICSEESLSFLIDVAVAKFEALAFDLNPDLLIPSNLNPTEGNRSIAPKKIRDLYIEEHESFNINIAGFAKYISDNMFARGIIKHAELQSAFTPVYLYQFSYYGRSAVKAFIDGAEKVGHRSEIPFLFKSQDLDDNVPKNVLVQKRIVNLWANFAKYEDPTPEKTELLDKVQWLTFSPENLQYLNINETLEIKTGLKKDIYSAWEEIFEQYGTQPFITY